jgi:nitrate reductase molybdenum cofactor assembly chaperone NarJ/NarW
MKIFNTPKSISTSLRASAWLLRYPDDSLRNALPAIRSALIEEAAMKPERMAEIDALIGALSMRDTFATESAYIDLFDRGRRTALHLFEHVHGDSRDRGPAMIDLLQTYAAAGLNPTHDELPDYLPMVLEYASTQPSTEARAFLREFTHILRIIFTALLNKNSAIANGYASVIAAIIELAGEKAERVPIAEEPALDEAWEEPEAFAGCSTQGQAKPGQGQPVHFMRTPSPKESASANAAAAREGAIV